MLPLLRILLIEQDPSTLKELSTNLSKVIPNFERNDIHIDIIEYLELEQALECVKEDGDIQAVVLSWDVQNKVG
jgi:lysine decarboxylase/arginine decarboxylase